jgi:hypothetical protein
MCCRALAEANEMNSGIKIMPPPIQRSVGGCLIRVDRGDLVHRYLPGCVIVGIEISIQSTFSQVKIVSNNGGMGTSEHQYRIIDANDYTSISPNNSALIEQ